MADKITKPEDIIDQTNLAESISDKIPYNFREDFLVKLLEPIKIEKEFQTPVGKTDKPRKDKNGVAAVDYDEVKTEKKEVDADHRLAVLLKIPYNFLPVLEDEEPKYKPFPLKVGDVIVAKNNAYRPFDLLKDSALIRIYDILGTVETKKNESK